MLGKEVLLLSSSVTAIINAEERVKEGQCFCFAVGLLNGYLNRLVLNFIETFYKMASEDLEGKPNKSFALPFISNRTKQCEEVNTRNFHLATTFCHDSDCALKDLLELAEQIF